MGHFNFSGKTAINELLERQKYTPDFEDLRKRVSIPLFVYDEYKWDFQKSEALPLFEDTEYYGTGATQSRRYKLRIATHDCDLQPTAFKTALNEVNSDHILGEVYGVNVTHIAFLDRELQNGIMAKREKVSIICHSQTSFGSFKTQDMWMYVGIEGAWDRIRSQLAAVVNYHSHTNPQMRGVRGFKHM